MSLIRNIKDALEEQPFQPSKANVIRKELSIRYTENVVSELLTTRDVLVVNGCLYVKTSDRQWNEALHLDMSEKIICANGLNACDFIGVDGLTYNEWYEHITIFIIDNELI